LNERDLVLREEGHVVEAGVSLVALVEERQLARRRGRVRLRQLEDAGPAAAAVVLGAGRVRVARLVEEERPELRVGLELAVLRALERRRVRGLRRDVGVERR